jgi:hypothetical protein
MKISSGGAISWPAPFGGIPNIDSSAAVSENRAGIRQPSTTDRRHVNHHEEDRAMRQVSEGRRASWR